MLNYGDAKDTLQDISLEENSTTYHSTNTNHIMSLETETETETDAANAALIESTSASPLRVAKPIASVSKRRLGYVLIVLVVILWCTSSFITQLLEEEQVTAFMVTLYSTCLLTLLLPYASCYDRITGERVDDATKRQIAYGSAKVLPLWYAANVLFNLSLCETSVASSTVVSSTSSAFCLLIGGYFGVESVDMFKIGGVVLSFIGVVFVSLADSDSGSSGSMLENVTDGNGCATQGSVFGDIISLVSALFYAMYTLCIRFSFPNQDDVRVDYLFGYLGALSMVVSIPYAIYQFAFMRVSLSLAAVGWLVLNAIVNNLLSDLFWAKAVLWTSPTIVTVGLSMNIPLSVFLDVLINNVALHVSSVFGGIVVVLGFFIVTKGS